jgi:hypothetical protein
MTQADRVFSTPPTNTSAINPVDPTRRGFITLAAGASIISVGSLAAVAAMPMAAAAPAALALDAELIELGARFELLADRYYVAHRRWSAALATASAENDREFPGADAGERVHVPVIAAAFRKSLERSGVDEASDALHAAFKEMAPLANTINAASVSSLEGFRAKALVAFWEVAPSGAGDSEFSFNDAWSFQQLFTAVAELCELKDKMAATGYKLPDIGMVEAAPDDDDDADDEGEEA